MPADKIFTTEDIIHYLNTDRHKGFVDRLATILKTKGFELTKLIDLTFHHDKQIAFRVAWLLDTMILENVLYYSDAIPYLTARVKEVTNESCKRHYSRILFRLTEPKAPAAIKNIIQNIEMDEVVEQLFDWVIDPKVKVAVKVFAADTLYNLSTRYDWINDELANQVEFMMRRDSAAIQSRGKKILALLQK